MSMGTSNFKLFLFVKMSTFAQLSGISEYEVGMVATWNCLFLLGNLCYIIVIDFR